MRGKKKATAPDPPKGRRERKLRHATRKPVPMKEGRPLDERAWLDS